MSAMRATGMKRRDRVLTLRHGLRWRSRRHRCRRRGRRRSRSRSRRPADPICPSMAASAIAIQNGCSPWSARCSDQLTVMSVGPRRHAARERRDACRRRCSQIARRPLRAIFALPVVRAAQVALEAARSRRSSGRGNRGRAAPRPPACAQAPASARCRYSGASGSHSASSHSGMSSRSGLTLTNSIAGRAAGAQGLGRGVPADAAGIDLGILQGEPAEGDDEPAVRVDRGPRRVLPQDRVCISPTTCGRITPAAAQAVGVLVEDVCRRTG